jgi:hypothetical protein
MSACCRRDRHYILKPSYVNGDRPARFQNRCIIGLHGGPRA